MVSNIKVVKLFGLVVAIVLINIIMLSPGLVGLTIGGSNAIETASSITILIISALVLIYGSYTLLFKSPVVLAVKDIKSQEDYKEGLLQYRHNKVLKQEIDLSIDQLERMEKKKVTLHDILNERFETTELSYKKFAAVIIAVETLFLSNIKGIINKLNVFDASELSEFIAEPRSASFSNKLMQQKFELHNEYVNYVKGYVGANEEILLKLDKLLLEISLLGSSDYRDVEEMPCMKEIDELIGQTKFYKQ
ncbi:hypothetical protein [Paenibacillus endoradicis]|uniref:hypothetical protein n=1 Tax=Paenibacillus endoradicis TaxID=2972487 RepID=UPI002158B465|nr:hypothetical protein [Paenibacillus endoradicis]MCR8659867.1 hypothetical protein [Paenibacillus endoradicis]